jgi:hypothetical protein
MRQEPVAAKRLDVKGARSGRRGGGDSRRDSEMPGAAIAAATANASSLRETTEWRSRTGLLIGVAENPLDQDSRPAKATVEATIDGLAPGRHKPRKINWPPT